MIKGVTRERIQAPKVRVATTLMYHSVRDNNGSADPTANETYAISAQRFVEHLDFISKAGHPVTTLCDLAEIAGVRRLAASRDPVREHAIVLTFDDGTCSHLETVLHLLWERNMPGEFFVNPVNVGRRGFLSWNELRGMASAGMSVQSHGYSHRCLEDLDDAVVADELLRSKKTIEDRVGQRVTVLAAPGGRVNAFVAALARRVGYKAVCGARPGQWRLNSSMRIIPRIAIHASTTRDDLRDWIDNRPFALTVRSGRYRILQVARRVLGNSVYDNLRQRYLSES